MSRSHSRCQKLIPTESVANTVSITNDAMTSNTGRIMELNVLPLLSTIANENNAGGHALRDGNRSLRAFDDAACRFRGALAEITAALQPKIGKCRQDSKHGAGSVSSSTPMVTELQSDNQKQGRTKCCSRSASRLLSSRGGNKHRRMQSATSISIQSPPLSSSSSPRTEYLFQVHQTRDEKLAQSESGETVSHLLLHHPQKVGFVHEEPITIDLAEMRDMATSIMCFRILSTSEQQHSSHKCGECMLRECLINLSVIIVYNLGLAYHLKSRQQLASCDSPEQIATHSRSLYNNLKKAQLLYCAVSRNMTRLPSLKYKLVLLNNLGQVYLDQNLREHARKCFEAVCRQVTKSLYECSGRNVLIPPSSQNDASDEAFAIVDTKLMRSLMITAVQGLLPDLHAAVA